MAKVVAVAVVVAVVNLTLRRDRSHHLARRHERAQKDSTDRQKYGVIGCDSNGNAHPVFRLYGRQAGLTVPDEDEVEVLPWVFIGGLFLDHCRGSLLRRRCALLLPPWQACGKPKSTVAASRTRKKGRGSTNKRSHITGIPITCSRVLLFVLNPAADNKKSSHYITMLFSLLPFCCSGRRVKIHLHDDNGDDDSARTQQLRLSHPT